MPDSNGDPKEDAAKASGRLESVFRGQSLRGMLLNAYAFGTFRRTPANATI